MYRYDCLEILAAEAKDALTTTTGGGAGAEWSSLRPSDGNLRCRTLGLVSSIALGLALSLPKRQILALDGDGALLMNLCGLPTLAAKNPPNLIHIVFDNGVYEASGAIGTATKHGADLVAIARGTGMTHAYWANTLDDFQCEVRNAFERQALTFIGAKVETSEAYIKQWSSLPSFSMMEVENTYRMMRYIEATENIPVVTPPGPRHKNQTK